MFLLYFSPLYFEFARDYLIFAKLFGHPKGLCRNISGIHSGKVGVFAVVVVVYGGDVVSLVYFRIPYIRDCPEHNKEAGPRGSCGRRTTTHILKISPLYRVRKTRGVLFHKKTMFTKQYRGLFKSYCGMQESVDWHPEEIR